MIFTAIDAATRRVLFAGSSDALDNPPAGVQYIENVEFYGDGWVDEMGRFVETPPRPSEHHQFNYTTKQWEDPRTPETEWPVVRAKRNQLLTASDWTQLPDVPLATKEAWAVYRQALRDITQQADPFNIVWPVPPA